VPPAGTIAHRNEVMYPLRVPLAPAFQPALAR
jgi:hypothetical protein